MNLAIAGGAEYIALRQFRAKSDTGSRLIAATGPHDSVGVRERYSVDVRF